jgi:hypothetical protein
MNNEDEMDNKLGTAPTYVSKRLHPHVYTLYILGKGETLKGRLFFKKNRDILEWEFGEILNLKSNRKILGGSEEIHKCR